MILIRYSTEVDVDFVRKSVRAIGRCAIKVEVSKIINVCCIHAMNAVCVHKAS